MAVVLLANEFGGGLGHVTTLAALAKCLASRHDLVFALPDAAAAAPVLRRALDGTSDGPRLVQGPRWAVLPAEMAAATARERPTHTLADPFDMFGFGDVGRLGTATDRWSAILAETSPDLIVADTAPALRLAASGRAPTVVVGNGYTMPPPGRALPPIRPWQEAVPAAARAVEARLLAAANDVRAARSGPAVDHWADLFAGEDAFVCTLPGFDPYRAHRTTPHTWPFVVPGLAPGPPAAERGGLGAFAYLPGHHPGLGAVVEALNRAGHVAEIYAPGLDPRRLADVCRPHVSVHTEPADLADVLPRCRLLVHHGGLNTAFAGLGAGTPQLVLPRNLEHTVTAQGLAHTGGTLALLREEATDPDRVCAAMARLWHEPRFAAAAAESARNFARRVRPEAVNDIVAACELHIGRR